MGIDAEIQGRMFLAVMHENARRSLGQRPSEAMLAAGRAASLERPHDPLGKLARSLRLICVRHCSDYGFALEDIAERNEPIADKVPAPRARLRAGMADGVASAIDQRNLAILKVGVGIA